MSVLITLSPPQAAWSPAHAEIGPISTITDVTGLWTASLERTDTMTPAGGWTYKVVEAQQGSAGSFLRVYYITVPGAGPYTVDQVWQSSSGSVPSAVTGLTTITGSPGAAIDHPSGPTATITVSPKTFDVSQYRLGGDPDWTLAMGRAAAALQTAGGGRFLVPPALATPNITIPILGSALSSFVNGALCAFAAVPVWIDVQTALVDQQTYTQSGSSVYGSYGTLFEVRNCPFVDASILGSSQLDTGVWGGGVVWINCIGTTTNYDAKVTVTGGAEAVRMAPVVNYGDPAPHGGKVLIVATQTHYGYAAADLGGCDSEVTIYAQKCGRPYDLQGQQNVRVWCRSTDIQTGAVIGSQASITPTLNLTVHHEDHSTPTRGGGPAVFLYFPQQHATIYRNLMLDLDIDSGQSGANGYGSILLIGKLQTDGVTPDTVGRGHVWDGGAIRGSLTSYISPSYKAIQMQGAFATPDDIRPNLFGPLTLRGGQGMNFDAGNALTRDLPVQVDSDGPITLGNVGSSRKFFLLPGTRGTALRPGNWGASLGFGDRISSTEPDGRQNLVQNSSGLTDNSQWSTVSTGSGGWVTTGGTLTATATAVYSSTGRSLRVVGAGSTQGAWLRLTTPVAGATYKLTLRFKGANPGATTLIVTFGGSFASGDYTNTTAPQFTGALQTFTQTWTQVSATDLYLVLRQSAGVALDVNFEAHVERITGTISDLIPTDGVSVTRHDGMSDVVYATGLVLPRNYGTPPRLAIAEGNNSRMGTAVLVAGTVVIPHTGVTATSRIFVTRSATGGTAGHLSYTISAGTSFTITSSNAADTSTINWLLIDPEV